MAAFFLSHTAAAQEEDLQPPATAPVKPAASLVASGGADNARKTYRDSNLSPPSVPLEYRCRRGVYSDRCYQVDSRSPRDPAVLFREVEFIDCRGGFLRPGTECVRHVRYP